MSLHELIIKIWRTEIIGCSAYDKPIRLKLWSIVAEFGYPKKLIALTKLTLTNAKSQVRVQNLLSEFFETMDGLRQGNAFSTLLFLGVLTWTSAVTSTEIRVDYSVTPMI